MTVDTHIIRLRIAELKERSDNAMPQLPGSLAENSENVTTINVINALGTGKFRQMLVTEKDLFSFAA